MTTLEQFHNDYVAHKGQCNLHLQPKLVIRLGDLHKDICRIFGEGSANDGYFAPFLHKLSSIILQINSAGTELQPDKDDSADLSTLAVNGDGAAFIYTMNMYTQVYYFLYHYFKNLPNIIKNKYMMTLYEIKPLLNAYETNLEWCISNSTYDPSYSKFETFGEQSPLMIKHGNKPLDSRVDM